MRLLRRTTLCVVAVIAGLCASAAVAHAQTVASTTTVSVAPNPSVAGQMTTLTAVVTGAGGTPTGTVQFSADGALIGPPVSLDGGQSGDPGEGGPRGRATSCKPPTAATRASIPSTGSTCGDREKANTVTALVSSANPVASGGPFELTAWIDIESPDVSGGFGTVQFFRDGVPLTAIALDGYDGVVGPVQAPVGPASADVLRDVQRRRRTRTRAPRRSSSRSRAHRAPPPPPPPPSHHAHAGRDDDRGHAAADDRGPPRHPEATRARRARRRHPDACHARPRAARAARLHTQRHAPGSGRCSPRHGGPSRPPARAS